MKKTSAPGSRSVEVNVPVAKTAVAGIATYAGVKAYKRWKAPQAKTGIRTAKPAMAKPGSRAVKKPKAM